MAKRHERGWYRKLARGKIERENDQSASSIDIRRRVDLPLSRRGTEPAEPTTISTTHDRQPPEGQYLVERLITKRKIESRNEYLVLWKGYPMEAASWEPAQHIEASLISEFNNPSPEEHIVRHYVALLRIEIDRSLKANCLKHTEIRIPGFRFDVFKFLFKDCNKTHLYSCDFDPEYFAEGWHEWIYKGDHGHTIVFPLKVKLYLAKSPPNGYYRNSSGILTPKPRPFVETLYIQLVKDNC